MDSLSPLDLAVLCAQLAATWSMVGLIWFVQVVHYPLFTKVGRGGFTDYEAAHRWRTTVVVGPPMLTEAAATVWLVLSPPPGVGPVLAWTGLALLVVIWATTMVGSVPAHDRLSGGFDADAVDRLVASNWVRTGAWTLRGVLALAMLVVAT
jgi:hypothetical protein